jgi:hypothetical protein
MQETKTKKKKRQKKDPNPGTTSIIAFQYANMMQSKRQKQGTKF